MAGFGISLVVVFSLAVRFAIDVLAVVAGLWVWNRWPAIGAMARRTSR